MKKEEGRQRREQEADTDKSRGIWREMVGGRVWKQKWHTWTVDEEEGKEAARLTTGHCVLFIIITDGSVDLI